MMRLLLSLLLLATLAQAQEPTRRITLAWDYLWDYSLPDGRPVTEFPQRGFRLLRQVGSAAPHQTLVIPPDDRMVTDTVFAEALGQPITYTLVAFVEGDTSVPSNAVFILPAPAMVTAQWEPLPPTEPPTDPPPTDPPPDLPPAGPYPPLVRAEAWQATASSQSRGAEAAKAIDGLLTSAWRTPAEVRFPQSLRLDLGAVVWLDGVRMTPRPDTRAGDITAYTLAVSPDGATWTTVAEGTWPSDATAKGVRFAAAKGRHVRLTATSTAGFAAIAELGVYGVEVIP